MKLEWADDGSVDITFRQSWLGTATNCLEQARLDIVSDAPRFTNEYAAMGTAVHAAAEAKLNDNHLALPDLTDIGVAAFNDIVDGAEGAGVKWQKFDQRTAVAAIITMIGDWERELFPQVRGFVAAEQQFNVLFDEFQLGSLDVRVRLQGTIDVRARGDLTDWKTSTRRYQWRDKQNSAIQPTVYAAAATRLGWLQWPVSFNYGIVIRSGGTQLLTVTRDQAHELWLQRLIRPYAEMAVRFGVDSPWPANDTSNLCAPQWCDYWAQCRGAYMTHIDPPTKKEKQ
jgi:hypothetical protein